MNDVAALVLGASVGHLLAKHADFGLRAQAFGCALDKNVCFGPRSQMHSNQGPM